MFLLWRFGVCCLLKCCVVWYQQCVRVEVWSLSFEAVDWAQCHQSASPSSSGGRLKSEISYIKNTLTHTHTHTHTHFAVVRWNQRHQSFLCDFSLCSLNRMGKEDKASLQVLVTLRQKSVILFVCAAAEWLCSVARKALEKWWRGQTLNLGDGVFNHRSTAEKTHCIKLKLNYLSSFAWTFSCIVSELFSRCCFSL